ncbi:MAG TPA: ATP-grasp domain-containing protein [Stellaceae bacterium]|nr:ATP-grasp domain-containing protein [Stellaceae bacterium]
MTTSLIVALSGRALALAAARAGERAIVLDRFADRDTEAYAERVSRLPGEGSGFDRQALLAQVASLKGRVTGLVYGAGFEGDPELLSALQTLVPLIGNSPEVVARVKEPVEFAALLAKLGWPHPVTRGDRPSGAGWLCKEVGGSGGGHIRRHPHSPSCESGATKPLSRLREREGPTERRTAAVGGRVRECLTSVDAAARASYFAGNPHPPSEARPPLPQAGEGEVGSYFQQEVPGTPLSVLFLADGRKARLVGFSEQWCAPTPEQPFRYGGCMGPVMPSPRVAEALTQACESLTHALGLKGLNSLDCLVEGDMFHLLEINPRPGATLDIFDGPDLPLWCYHRAAVAGTLPLAVLPSLPIRAASILYALRRFRLEKKEWPRWTSDWSADGTFFEEGDPICTIHATALHPRPARARLEDRARRLLDEFSAMTETPPCSPRPMTSASTA